VNCDKWYVCFIFNIFVFLLFPSNYIFTYLKIIVVVVTFKIMLQLNKMHIQDINV
jgi:hypothetical protein